MSKTKALRLFRSQDDLDNPSIAVHHPLHQRVAIKAAIRSPDGQVVF